MSKTDQNSKLRRIFTLFTTFFRIGAFTFGGGYAMIPLIQRDVVEKHKWITDDDILEIVAIAESTPGPIAINSATFVGYRVAGFFGAVFATFGVVLPSFVIISLISLLLNEFQSITAVRYAFFGIRAGVLALLLKALVGMYRKCPKKIVSYCVIAFAFILSVFTEINLLFVIIGCALIGLIYSLALEKRAKNGNE